MKIKLSQFEKDVFGQLLEVAAEQLSNNSCNDYPVPVTDENRADLLLFIDEIAEDDEEREHLRDQAENREEVYFRDDALMGYLHRKVMGE